MELDIRDDAGVVDSIRVYSIYEGGPCVVDCIRKMDGGVVLFDTISFDSLWVMDKAHAQDIIKGINKAIELGWLK